MRDQIDLQAIVDPRFLDRLLAGLQSDHILERQQMHATQVEIGVRRRKAVQVRPADRGEEQRIRMKFDLPEQAWIVRHGRFSDKAERRASIRNALAFS